MSTYNQLIHKYKKELDNKGLSLEVGKAFLFELCNENSVDPDKDDAYEKRAQIYYEQKKYDLADADYKRLISLDQGGVMGYMGIGRNRNAQKMWDEAIEQFSYLLAELKTA